MIFDALESEFTELVQRKEFQTLKKKLSDAKVRFKFKKLTV